MNWGQNSQLRGENNRIAQFQVVATGVFVLLLLAFWEIQVVNGDYYRKQAEENRVKSLPVPAARGIIRDRHGRALAQSRVVLAAMINPVSAQTENLKRIGTGLRLDPVHVLERLRNAAEFGKAEHISLKDSLSIADIAFLQAHRREFQEIALIEGMRRQYPNTGVAVHAVGYVGEVSKSELNMREFLLYAYGAEIGKSGIERQYNDWLGGEAGKVLFLVDSHGRRLDTLGVIDSVPGKDLYLTIDLDLQAVAELGLEGRKGAIVALDPSNGEILAMASSPVYDPNKFVAGLSGREWQAINSDRNTPLLNRAIQGTWAMGSVFKPIHGLAGLEAGLAGPDFQVHCPGGLQFGSRYFRCHKRGGHGTVDLLRAIALSCDVFFYRLGDKLGIEKLAHYARLAGLGEKTLVDLPDEVPGLVPSIRWKIRRTLQPWYPGETIVVAIGQGAMSVTPIQAAHAIGGLAMGGVWQRPHLVLRDKLAATDPRRLPPPPRTANIKPEHMEVLREAMRTVVNGAGTGRQARLSGIEVCGKTGTSQRVSNELRLRAKREDFEDDAWFVGFAPCSSPEIVVAVLLENGRHSYYAAAVARDVLQAWRVKESQHLLTDLDRTLAASKAGPRPMVSEE
jgi:penicillin-binding protein 2